MKVSKNILFLGVHYELESSHVGDGSTKNGYTSYSNGLIDELAKYNTVTVITDKPDLYNGKKNVLTINIFNGKNSVALLSTWKTIFSQISSDGKSFYSRDTIARFTALVNVIESDSLNAILNDTKFDYIFFNRHEYALLGGLVKSVKCRKVLVAHDSAYLRRKNFENILRVNQPLLNFERAIEIEIASQQEKIITLSPVEAAYFSKISKDTQILSFSPPVSLPKKIKRLKYGTKVNFYFLGVNNAINLQTITKAFNEMEKIQQTGIDCNFNIIGSISSHPDVVMVAEKKGYITHGVVNDLSSCLDNMDVQIAPIALGSGAPLKIADALSHGHFVITSDLASGPYEEFVNNRIIIESDIPIAISKIFKISMREGDTNSYTAYFERNSLKNKF